ncbi:hypothetical protein V3C33_03910 [Micrococcaceae bacterium Sec5.7]
MPQPRGRSGRRGHGGLGANLAQDISVEVAERTPGLARPDGDRDRLGRAVLDPGRGRGDRECPLGVQEHIRQGRAVGRWQSSIVRRFSDYGMNSREGFGPQQVRGAVDFSGAGIGVGLLP